MSQEKTLIPKLNDRDVIRAYLNTSEKFGAPAKFNDQIGELNADDVEQYETLGGYSLHTAYIMVETVRYIWRRQREQPSTGDDSFEVHLSTQLGASARPKIAEVSAALLEALSRPLASVSDPKAARLLKSHNNVLSAMESVSAQLISDSAKYSRELQESYQEKEQKLTERIDELREKDISRLEADRSRSEADISARAAALDSRQSELDALQKSLDDRNNTHVRRQIRESLLAMTKDRLDNFSISKQTRSQHLLVNGIALIGLFFLISASAYYGANLIPTSTLTSATFYTMVAKSSFFAASAVALGYWYLGWQNRWLQRFADAEFRLQQFRLDIERASWLAETVLEWKQASEEPIPELLVTRLSAGLFQADQSELLDPKTPAAQLAEALMGAASTAKLKIGEQEILLDRKSIKRLSEE